MPNLMFKGAERKLDSIYRPAQPHYATNEWYFTRTSGHPKYHFDAEVASPVQEHEQLY